MVHRRASKAGSEAKREQTICRLYSSAFCDIPHVDLVGDSTDACALPDDYVGRPSTDSALNAFAQLATIRLGTQRALISLIDSHRQHILAESTPSMPLRHLAELHTPGNLWLGNVSIPRSWGVCEHILGVQPALLNEAQNTVIINDLQQVDKFASRSYVTDAPHARFYAGVALVGPNGAVVGALCVLDDKPRNGLPEEDLLYLRELSTTITEYLGTYSLKDAYRQGEQLTRGLISFTEGAATLQSHRSRSLPSTEPLSSPKPFEILDSPELVSRTHGGVHSTSKVPLLRSQSSDMSQSTQDSTAGRGNSIARMQDRILPLNSKDMFARAANVMRASRELDGVLILDTSVAAAGQRQGGENVDAATEIEGDSSSLSRYSTDREGSHRSEDESPERPQMKRKKCEILAFSTKEGSSVRGDTIEAGLGTLLESDLGQLLRQFPKGKVIHFDAVGERIASTSDSDSSSTSLDKHGVSQERPRRRTSVERSRPKRAMDALRSAFPEARSVAFIPFWDYERSRWFAGCLCWTNNPLRPLIPEIDLIYFKVFGHTIMSELSRLDHAVTAEAKTSFAASVSHELRSPLHGILGTLQFLHGTALDSFQVNMLNSMSACGRTLLDTVDHVLDYSKINDTKRSTSTKTITGERTVRLVAKARKSRMSACSRKKGAAIDLALITEESIEAIFSGQTFNVTVGSGAERATSSMEAGQETIDQDPNAGVAERKGRFVVLDISQLENWQFCVPAGAWRRIVMNIFANALKHTESGSIQVLLRTAEQTSGAATLPRVILTVSDTGSGMSQEFLAHRLFQAFTQENPHLPGTGLGMSIVRQIIETIGGRIDVTSHSEGTQFVVRLALARPQDLPGPLLQGPRSIEPMSNLRGRTVRILHKAYPKLTGDANFDAIAKHRSIFVEALMRTLRTCLKMHVTQTTEWACHGSHIFICPEPSFEYLNEIRARRTAGDKAPITIFIAMDGIEATTLRSDARIMSKESVVEIMTQPCGPHKLANILNHCLTRYNAANENISSPRDTTLSFDDMFSLAGFGPAPAAELDVDIPTESREQTPIPTLSLPSPGPPDLRTPQAASPPASSESIPILTKNEDKYVLITDDNSINRKLLATFLKRNKVKYQEAHNGLEALKAYSEGPIRFDVILMDVSMPVMDGMTATRAIREYEKKNKVPRTNIIALTGLASASARLEAWGSGVDNFMTKPVNFEALKEILLSGGAGGGKKGRVGGRRKDGSGKSRDVEGEGVGVGGDGMSE